MGRKAALSFNFIMLTVSFTAFLLSLGCGLGFAASDYFRKKAADDCPAMLVLFYFIGGQMPILATWLIFSGELRWTNAYIGPGVVDVGLGLCANLFFVLAVRRSPLSLMVPLLALVPVLTAAAGALVLREMLSPFQIGGTGMIVVGLFVLYGPGGRGMSFAATWQAFRREPGVPFMLLTILCWSLTPVFDKMCVNASSVPMHGLIQIVAIWLLAGIWMLAKGGLKQLIPVRSAFFPLMGGAISAGLAYGLQLAAYLATLVAVVEGLKRVTGLLSSLIVGRVFFGEAMTRPKVAGVAILAVGVPLILIG